MAVTLVVWCGQTMAVALVVLYDGLPSGHPAETGGPM